MTDEPIRYPAKAPPALWAKIKPLARQKRHEPTPAEQVLWQRLRNRQLRNAKLRRQHVIDRFIVDFYCARARLIVEVDGPIHDYTPEEDALRQEFLEAIGFTVIRFQNEAVLQSTEDVMAQIEQALADRLPSA
ncbi:MAG TPA: endonuclease domain-containing protein [Spirillospora sp.]|nr:endonuclease domain-containing protein [Spirillospora sp.]